ncbi:2,3-dihydro-2,3-dihydroxybenzoate dehydrogenase [Rhodomicrobium lacus]|uniref:2,3-dihydro-2,3-dihydroxybenzoate dehydrogenase n=1 Tax=Rhodomicrobium lacus TaxID=2498452 RepID=UPI003CCAB052
MMRGSSAMSLRRFRGKRVLVTGAARGIGHQVAERFAEEGANVIGLDIAASARALNFTLHLVDISDPDQVGAISNRLKYDAERLDVLVNAAGVLEMGPVESLATEAWKRCFDVNVAGPFYLFREWIPVFKKQRGGAIVNIASNAAHVARTHMASYCASKAALTSLSHCVGLEVAPYGVRCNVVSPGSTDTPMLSGMLTSGADRDRLLGGFPDQFKLGIPLGKIATPDDIADVTLFLASNDAGHVTLQDIVVDGGATLGA